MSLINRMLNDLQRRRAEPAGDGDAALEDIYPVSEEELHWHGGRRISPAAILFFGALISVFLVLLFNKGRVPAALQAGRSMAAEIKPVPAPAATAAPADSGTASAGTGATGKAGARPGRVPGMDLKLDGGADLGAGGEEGTAPVAAAMEVGDVRLKEYGKLLNIELNLPREAQYLVYTLNEPNRVVLELTGARYDGALPDINAMQDVRAIRQREEEDGTYKLVVETGRRMLIDTTNMEKQDSDYILHVNMTPETLADADAPLRQTAAAAPEEIHSGTMNITPAADDGIKRIREEDNDASRIDQMVYQARRLYQDGEVNKGLNKLMRAVKQAPGNVHARTTLAVLLFEQGQDDLAKYILGEGLRSYPHRPEWAKILARALYSEGDLDGAQTILEAAAPPVKGHLDYHALYAGVLQKKGEHPRAAIVYRNLLQLQPSNGTWWMGLAISLEAMSRKDDAITAYRHALNTPRLSPDSTRFVKDRLDRLNQQSG